MSLACFRFLNNSNRSNGHAFKVILYFRLAAQSFLALLRDKHLSELRGELVTLWTLPLTRTHTHTHTGALA